MSASQDAIRADAVRKEWRDLLAAVDALSAAVRRWANSVTSDEAARNRTRVLEATDRIVQIRRTMTPPR